jgi:hypothetical protein
MLISEVKKLKPGDEIFWEDPDGGECSRVLKIKAIRLTRNVVHITETSGAYVECFARELRY